MKRILVYKPAAQRELARMSRSDATRIIRALEAFAADGRGDVKALKGALKGRYRLVRTRRWRYQRQAPRSLRTTSRSSGPEFWRLGVGTASAPTARMAATFFVSPRVIGSAELFSEQWSGFDGPAIQISTIFGDTSGRFSVARKIARVFPVHSSFVEDVIAEGIEPASEFRFGPYPGDKLKYMTTEMVEFLTPANANGMGTASRLLKNGNPISGVAILSGEELNLTILHVRLPPELVDLVPLIVRQAERD